jgi:hypothetical protein
VARCPLRARKTTQIAAQQRNDAKCHLPSPGHSEIFARWCKMQVVFRAGAHWMQDPYPYRKQIAALNLRQIERAIRRLGKRINDLEALDTSKIERRKPPKAALRNAMHASLYEIPAKWLDGSETTVTLIGSEHLEVSRQREIALLKKAIVMLKERTTILREDEADRETDIDTKTGEIANSDSAAQVYNREFTRVTERDTVLEKFKDIRIAVIVALAEEYQIFCRYFHGTVVEKFHVGDLT